MGELTSFLQNLFGSSNTPATAGVSVPTVPRTDQIVTGASPNQFNTPNFTSGLGGITGLQMGQLGLGAANGLLSTYLGFSGLNQAKSQARQAQNNWDKQWSANVRTTNAALEDRQRARLASNPNGYEGVDSYMKKYGIS